MLRNYLSFEEGILLDLSLYIIVSLSEKNRTSIVSLILDNTGQREGTGGCLKIYDFFRTSFVNVRPKGSVLLETLYNHALFTNPTTTADNLCI